MAEADDSGDYQEKPKPKYKYKKELRLIGGKKRWVNVSTPIKQPEPYIGAGGVVITGEHKPEPGYKRIRKGKKNYANLYTKPKKKR